MDYKNELIKLFSAIPPDWDVIRKLLGDYED